MHKTSPIWAFNSARHPFSGRCQGLYFLCKDTEESRCLIAVVHPRAIVDRISTQANQKDLDAFRISSILSIDIAIFAQNQEGNAIVSSLNKIFSVFHAGVRYLAECLAGLNAQIGHKYRCKPLKSVSGPDLSTPDELGDDFMRV